MRCKTKPEFQRRYTAQKMKFSIEDFFSKCDQIRSFLRIWSHLLKKSLMENFIFCAVINLFLINCTRGCHFELKKRVFTVHDMIRVFCVPVNYFQNEKV